MQTSNFNFLTFYYVTHLDTWQSTVATYQVIFWRQYHSSVTILALSFEDARDQSGRSNQYYCRPIYHIVFGYMDMLIAYLENI